MIRTTVKLLQPSKLSIDDAFEHPYLLLSIAAICLSFIVFVIYNYYTASSSDAIQSSYSYFSKNPAIDVPVFQLETSDSNICQTRCKQDPTCDGITFDANTSLCIGSKNGVLRSDDVNFSAWVKPDTAKDPYLSKTIITSYAADPYTVKSKDIPSPSMVGQFSYSFWLNIYDWYLNFEYWKHIAHKGSEIVGTSVNCREWSEIVSLLPDQCPGFWLAPFTNNLRIAVTTEVVTPVNENPAFKDANVVICDKNTGKCILSDQLFNLNQSPDSVDNTALPIISKNIEYTDIENIPINKLYHVALTFNANIMEIYINGGLFKVVRLKGTPIFNRGNMYIKFDKSFNGAVYQMAYIPLYTKLTDIKQLYNAKPKI